MVEIDAGNAPDLVNVTYAHEATHRLLDEANSMILTDLDTDEVPDDWEADLGVSIVTDTSFSIDQLNVSQSPTGGGSAASPDEEFYCVVGGAFRFGTITRNGNSLNAGNPGDNGIQYRGKVPEDAEESLDWTTKGTNW